MSTALTSKSAIRDLRDKTLELACVLAGNYVNSGTTGDVVDLSRITNTLGQSNAQFGFPWKIVNGEIIGNIPGYEAVLVPPASGSATPWLWGIRILQTGAALSGPLAELGNGAYPGALTAAGASFTLRFRGPKASC